MASPLNDSLPPQVGRRSPDSELSANRKLIRPSLAEVRDQMARVAPPSAPPRTPKKPVPPDQTNAESFYFL
jgi:hypothetical protein